MRIDKLKKFIQHSRYLGHGRLQEDLGKGRGAGIDKRGHNHHDGGRHGGLRDEKLDAQTIFIVH